MSISNVYVHLQTDDKIKATLSRTESDHLITVALGDSVHLICSRVDTPELYQKVADLFRPILPPYSGDSND